MSRFGWTGWLALAAFVGLVVLGLCDDAQAAPAGFVQCAAEEATCTVSVDSWVTFGSGDATCDVGAGTCGAGYVPLVSLAAGASLVCNRYESFGGLDPAPNMYKACYSIAKSASPPSSPGSGAGLDWSKTNHVLQALIVAICAIAFVMGYRAGDKL